MNATFIVISSTAQLISIEKLLGDSKLRDLDLGSPRKNGLIRKQSIWMRDWSVSAEPPESPLSQILEWYSPMKDQLLALDPDAFVKLSVDVSSTDTFAIPPKLASQLHTLKVYVTVDFINQSEPLA